MESGLKDWARPGQVNVQAGQPKEIGVLQRIEGLRSGLSSLRSRIEAFYDRLQGTGDAAEKQPMPAAGIYGNMSEAESDLRICLSMIQDIDNKF